MSLKILVINPGSTSTKIAVYNNTETVLKSTIKHDPQKLKEIKTLEEQKEYRFNLIKQTLQENGIQLDSFSAIVSRGAPLAPVRSGTYLINEKMLYDIDHPYIIHVSLVGPKIADMIAKKYNIPAFIVDPVSVDELADLAKISGLKELPRKSVTHALNMKAVGRKFAQKIGKPYEELTIIIAHMGGGITAALHHRGKMLETIDSNGEGPFSPERSGVLRVDDLVRMCYESKLTYKEMIYKLTRQAGCFSHLGTFSMIEIDKRIEAGDKYADFIVQAMCYNVSKHIAGLTVLVAGQIDGIVLTGGLLFSKTIVKYMTSFLKYLGDITIFPGEFELEALRDGALRVLQGQEKPLNYPDGKEVDLNV